MALRFRGLSLCQPAWICLSVGLCALLPCCLICMSMPFCAHMFQLASSCLALSVVAFAESESNVSYLSTALKVLLSLPASCPAFLPLPASFPGVGAWTSQLANQCSQGCRSSMHPHQGWRTELLICPTFLSYTEKSTV